MGAWTWSRWIHGISCRCPSGRRNVSLADVVRVEVDFPLAAGSGGRGPSAVLVECHVVVGAVVDADAAVGDRVEAHRQQFGVVGFGRGQRHVAARAQQYAPHLARGQGLLGQEGVAQPVVGAVLPARGDPLVQ